MSLIRKPNKIYWLDTKIKGRRYRRSLHTSHKTIALARYGDKLEALQAEFGDERIRLIDFAKKYMEWAWSSKPASALREQQRLYKIVQFLVEVCRIVYLDEITPYHIEQLKAELNKRKLSKATINRYLQILRGLFYKAIDWEVYDKPNPLKKIRFYREESRQEALSDDELKKILNASKAISANPQSKLQKAFHDICLLAINTGMRKSEVLNLTVKSVKGNTVRIKGKGDKVRVIPLNEQARQVITKNRLRMEFDNPKDDYVFDVPNRHQPDLFRRTIMQIRKMTGVAFHFHRLRHTFASRLLSKGVDIVTIGEILGHSQKMTSLLYSHTNEEQMRKAVDTI